MKIKYEVAMTFKHWVVVEAESEDEAFSLAEDQIPSFVSDLDDYEAELEIMN